MDKICCILDSDESFAVRICACFNKKHVFPFMVHAFSDVNEYISCARVNEVALLIVDEGMYEEVRHVVAGQIIRLCEQPMLMEGEADACIAKFQASDNIIRDVLGVYSGQLLSQGRQKQPTASKLVCVYSPNGYCGKTTLALALSHIKGQEKRVLYLNFEEFSAIDMDNGNGTLSDALYYFRIASEYGSGKLLSVICHGNGFDYIAPTACAQDIAWLDTDVMLSFIEGLSRLGEYELIVVDMGSLIKEPWKLLSQAGIILSPVPDSLHRQRRQKEFEKYMYMAGYEAVMDRVRMVDIIQDNSIARDGHLNYAYILGSRYGRMVGAIDI